MDNYDLKKTNILLIVLILTCSFCGCVDTSMITEEQRVEAIQRYPFSEPLNISPENGPAMVSLKIFGRVLADIFTLGLGEIILYDDRASTYNTYIKHDLIYDQLIHKKKSDLIKVLGAPSRTFPDGLGGEIYIYETDEIRGGGNQYGSWVKSYKKIFEFYFGESGFCYKWRRIVK